jgi:hypothetical protein
MCECDLGRLAALWSCQSKELTIADQMSGYLSSFDEMGEKPKLAILGVLSRVRAALSCRYSALTASCIRCSFCSWKLHNYGHTKGQKEQMRGPSSFNIFGCGSNKSICIRTSR